MREYYDHDLDFGESWEPSRRRPPPDTSAWTSADGRRIPLAKIDDQYLANIIALVARWPNPHSNSGRAAWTTALAKELDRRKRLNLVVKRVPLSPIYRLRVDRLLEFYNPFPHVMLAPADPLLQTATPQPEHTREYTPEWHAGRVRHLAELMATPGYVPDPLVVHGTNGVLDGHHRLIAAGLAGIELLPSEFIGDPMRLPVLLGEGSFSESRL